MRFVSFDALRTLGMPKATYIKPEKSHCHMDVIRQADWLLFPEYWQINTLFYGMRKQIFPSMSTYHIGHDKIEMTRVMQLLWPQYLPETHILGNSSWACDWVPDHFGYPFVAKTPRAAMGMGVWLIDNRTAWERYASCHPTLYVQEYLPIEKDLRLVVIGKKVVTAYWRCRPGTEIHTNVAKGGLIHSEDIPPEAIVAVEMIAHHLEIDHAGFDVAVVEGKLFFFEFNRLFGTAGLVKKGISIAPLILQYLLSKKIVSAAA